MTISCSSSRLQHLGTCWDGIIRLHSLSKSCWCRHSYNVVRLHLNICHQPQFGCTVLHISLTEVISRIPPTWLGQFVKHYEILVKPPHAVQLHFGDTAQHPAKFINFTPLAPL